MGLTFFGLTSTSAKDYRVTFLTQIHEICFYGQGGYRWQEVYDMPIWLRKFTYHKIKEHYDKQSKAIKDSKQNNSNVKTMVGEDGKITSPNIPNKTNYS